MQKRSLRRQRRGCPVATRPKPAYCEPGRSFDLLRLRRSTPSPDLVFEGKRNREGYATNSDQVLFNPSLFGELC